MTDLSHISDVELLFDRQECYNDLVACLAAKSEGVTRYSGGSVQDRFDTNLRHIDVITQECKRRGFDPAQHDQVKLRL